ncbi:MAG: hypothetical protein R3293_08845 [Candidatus Promineifilaceae bacterium]|nr:hypothetical protein [Candidatus Promineifilaceae bacterium]
MEFFRAGISKGIRQRILSPPVNFVQATVNGRIGSILNGPIADPSARSLDHITHSAIQMSDYLVITKVTYVNI